ncbi:hypothetical protein GE21DRAFT_1292384 [Neurospora crassa]|nr:hypothetical protein GE21DRAFT_1292384 [Neurospora crassa]
MALVCIGAKVGFPVRVGFAVGGADELGTVPQLLGDRLWVNITDTSLPIEHDNGMVVDLLRC